MSSSALKHESLRPVLSAVNRILTTLFGYRFISAAEHDRLKALAYRLKLRNAELHGSSTFLEGELSKHQLDEGDLERLTSRHTPIAEWPDDMDDPFAVIDTPGGAGNAEPEPATLI